MLIVIGNILLGLAALLIVLNAMLHPSIALLVGPDKAGASIQIILVGVLRAIVIAGAVVGLAVKGRFEWIAQSEVAAGLAAVLLAVAVDVVATACSTAGVEARRGPGWVRPAFAITGTVVSAVLGVYLFALLNEVISPASSFNWLALAGGVVVVVTALGWWASSAIAWNREHAERIAANEVFEREKQAKYQADRLAQMEAIPDAAGLGPLLQFLGATEGPDVHRRVLERASARPAEVTELLTDKYKIEALEYLRFEGVPVRPEWAPAVDVAIRGVAEHLKRGVAKMREYDRHPDTFSWECRLVANVARRYRGLGVDYAPALRDVLAAVDSLPGHQFGQGGRQEIERVLQTVSGR